MKKLIIVSLLIIILLIPQTSYCKDSILSQLGLANKELVSNANKFKMLYNNISNLIDTAFDDYNESIYFTGNMIAMAAVFENALKTAGIIAFITIIKDDYKSYYYDFIIETIEHDISVCKRNIKLFNDFSKLLKNASIIKLNKDAIDITDSFIPIYAKCSKYVKLLKSGK